VTVGGKTGTAQDGRGRAPYAWLCRSRRPRTRRSRWRWSSSLPTWPDDISGGRIAAPIARSVMEAVLE
jgi:hypothetical protein